MELVGKFFAGAPEGTSTVELGGGYKLKAGIKYNYRLDPDQTAKALDKIIQADPAGKMLAARLVKWAPELRVGEWRKLPEKLAKIIAGAISVSPATPSLELVAPEA